MDVVVNLFATLQQGRFRRKTLDMPVGSTALDLCQHLAIDPREITILMVNGTATHRGHPLEAGDEVSVFPAIGGG
jgi:sulfur carrier protein ThiS